MNDDNMYSSDGNPGNGNPFNGTGNGNGGNSWWTEEPGNGNNSHPAPIDNYIPILVIAAVSIIFFFKNKIKLSK